MLRWVGTASRTLAPFQGQWVKIQNNFPGKQAQNLKQEDLEFKASSSRSGSPSLKNKQQNQQASPLPKASPTCELRGEALGGRAWVSDTLPTPLHDNSFYLGYHSLSNQGTCYDFSKM